MYPSVRLFNSCITDYFGPAPKTIEMEQKVDGQEDSWSSGDRTNEELMEVVGKASLPSVIMSPECL